MWESTLCKTLNGLIPHFIVGDMEGMVKIDGVDTREQEIGSLAKKAGYVYQDLKIRSCVLPCWRMPLMPA